MAICDQCGNDYVKSFRVNLGDATYSFECAIQKLAPICPHCGVRIIGHESSRPTLFTAARIVPNRRVPTLLPIARLDAVTVLFRRLSANAPRRDDGNGPALRLRDHRSLEAGGDRGRSLAALLFDPTRGRIPPAALGRAASHQYSCAADPD